MGVRWVQLDRPKPVPVDDCYRYWGEPPPQLSPRCRYWLRQIERGWRPNRRLRGMGYDAAARWYGIYIWEYLHQVWPAAEEIYVILTALSRARFRYRNELELHEGITAVLNQAGVRIAPEHREVRLSPTDRIDRIDFLLPSGLGIEVKVDGTPGDVWRQLHRYATHDRVRALLLVTTRARHLAGLPIELDEKPVTAFLLRGGLR